MVWETLLELTSVGVSPIRSSEDAFAIALSILELTSVSACFKRLLSDSMLAIRDPLTAV